MMAYSNNGQSMRTINPGTEDADEIVFDHIASEAELRAAFPGRMLAIAEEGNGRTLQLLMATLEAHYDATAQTRRYDNRLTCALRAGFAGPFQAEGTAFAVWMDTCNARGYQIMADCLAGRRAIPTPEGLVAEMPVMVWP